MENELYHYGRKGMKWYQNIYSKYDKMKGTIKGKFKSKQQETVQETTAQKKERLKRSGTAKEVLRNADLFDDKELQAITNRLGTKRTLSSYASEELSKPMRIINSASKTMNTISSAVDTASKTYNNTAKVLNKLVGTDLPTLDGGPKNDTKVSKTSIVKKGMDLSKLTDEELADASKRIENLNKVNNYLDKLPDNEEKKVSGNAKGRKGMK